MEAAERTVGRGWVKKSEADEKVGRKGTSQTGTRDDRQKRTVKTRSWWR